MDALEAMRTIGANRFYLPDDVPDEVIYDAVEAARFAPQGGNRQPVRLVVVRDPAKKERLAELYLPWWKAYFDAAEGGTRKLGEYASARRALLNANEFAEHFAEHPLIIVVCAKLADLHITDLEHGRPPVVGGASIYPFVQNLCIALRVQGVATHDHHPALRLRARGQGAARDPRRVPDRLPRRRRLPGQGLPDEADPGAGRGDHLPRHASATSIGARGSSA